MSNKENRWIRHFAIVSSVIVISLVLFRGTFEQGMEMDEVTRVINLIPLLNGGAQPVGNAFLSFDLFGRSVPVMFKEYISSAYLLRFVPLAFFPDPLTGIRFLYWFYFIASVLVFYAVAARHDWYVAAFGALLIISSPLFYPEVRIGFADTLHILYVSGAAYFFERFLFRGERSRDLFVAVFLLFFCANQIFYFSWVIAAVGLSALLLYPGYVWEIFRTPGRFVVVFLAACAGLINFVVYNLVSGMPTLVVLFNRWFRPEEYARAPIDFKVTRSLPDEIRTKLIQLPQYFDAADVYVWGYLCVAAILVVFLLVSLSKGRLKSRRPYFFPVLVALITLVLVLLTPNTTRVGHYVFLAPALQLSVISAILGLASLLGKGRLSRSVTWVAPLLVLTANLTVSNEAIARRNRTGGTRLFTPAVFEFSDYLNEHSIDSRNILFTVWGLYAQPYFLNWGDFTIRQVVYDLIDLRDAAAQQAFIDRLFCSYQALPISGDRLYLPLYADYRTDINDALLDYLDVQGAEVTLEKSFLEKNGTPAILLYRVDGVPALMKECCAPIRQAPACSDIAITKYGPESVAPDREEDLAMWFMGTNLTPSTRVTLDGILLRTVFAGDYVTALVPAARTREAGQYPLNLYDFGQKCHSNTVQLKVEKQARKGDK